MFPAGSEESQSASSSPFSGQLAEDLYDTPFKGSPFVEARNVEEASNSISSVVEPRQLLPVEHDGSTDTVGSIISMQNVQLFGLNIADPVKVVSGPLVSYNIIVPVAGELYGCEGSTLQRVPLGSAHVVSPQQAVNVQWQTPSKFIVVRIPQESMVAYAQDVYGLPFIDNFSESSLLDLGSGAGGSLANLLQMIHHEADRDDSLLNRQISTGALEDLMMTTVLGIHLDGRSGGLASTRSRGLPRSIKRSIDYIEANASQDISMRALTEVAGCSLRTLQSGFARHYGMGPRAFITRVKLLKVRDALRQASAANTTVGSVAGAWGFYNASNFTENYKRAFGELPSETLKR